MQAEFVQYEKSVKAPMHLLQYVIHVKGCSLMKQDIWVRQKGRGQ